MYPDDVTFLVVRDDRLREPLGDSDVILVRF